MPDHIKYITQVMSPTQIAEILPPKPANMFKAFQSRPPKTELEDFKL